MLHLAPWPQFVCVTHTQLLHWGNTWCKHQYKQIGVLGKCNASRSVQTAHYTLNEISESRRGIQTSRREQEGLGALAVQGHTSIQFWGAHSGCPRYSLILWSKINGFLQVSPPVNSSKGMSLDSQALWHSLVTGFGVKTNEVSSSVWAKADTLSFQLQKDLQQAPH